jgi:hypothetical protein
LLLLRRVASAFFVIVTVRLVVVGGFDMGFEEACHRPSELEDGESSTGAKTLRL